MIGKKKVFLLDKTVIYNNLSNNINQINTNEFGKNRHIIILNEEIFIKKLEIKKYDSVEEIIYKYFGKNNDYLYHHFKINKGKTLIIYAVKGGNRVSALCNGADQVKVSVLQDYLIKYINKIIKVKEWDLIFQFMDSYYYIKYKDNYINANYIERDFDMLIKKINSFDSNINLFIDNNIKFNINCSCKKTHISLGGLYGEKRLFIQKLFT